MLHISATRLMGKSQAAGRSPCGAAGQRSDAMVAPTARPSIFSIVLMPTSVHIPKPLLLAVDRRARALKVTAGADWPAGFFEELGRVQPELVSAVDEMTRAIQANRRSKAPTKL